MKISGISAYFGNSFCVNKSCAENNKKTQTPVSGAGCITMLSRMPKPFFLYNNGKKENISFRGGPKALDYTRAYNARDMITIWEQLFDQNCSDVFDDHNHPEYKKIRENNYRFLYQVDDLNEQKKFIRYFNAFTKFPDLKKVSERMEQAFMRAITESRIVNNVKDCSDNYDVIMVGYNTSCSVGRGLALPGSDIDGAYIILRGDCEDKTRDDEIVDNFKKTLWGCTDARLVSYNHADAFPQVYTLNQIDTYLKEINKNIEENGINAITFERQKCAFQKYSSDYKSANPFYVEFINNFKSDKISKEDVKNFGFFADSLVHGKTLYSKGIEADRISNRFKNNIFCEHVNLSQISGAMKKRPKKKLAERKKLEKNFHKYDISQQYRIIRDIIMGMSEDNKNEAFFGKDKDLYTPFIQDIVGGGNENK